MNLVQRRSHSDSETPVQLTDWMLAVLCNGLGRYEEALAAAQEASNDSPEEIFVSAWATVELVEAATRCDNPKLADVALERILAATAFARSDSARGIEARCRALVSEGTTAEHLYGEAVERLGRSRLRPQLARGHLLFGEWLRREGRRVEARQQLAAAYDQLELDRHGGLRGARPGRAAGHWREGPQAHSGDA